MFPIRWKSAPGARPGRSLTTLRYFLRLLLRPSSTASSSGLPMECSTKPYRSIQRPSSERPNSVLISGEKR